MFSFANVTCLKRRTLVVKIGAKAHGGGFGVPGLHISFSDTSLVWVDLQFPDLAARSPGHRWGTCCFGILSSLPTSSQSSSNLSHPHLLLR